MKRHKLALSIAVVFVIAQVGVLALVAYFAMQGSLPGPEIKVTFAVITPTLAAYAATGLAYILKHEGREVRSGPVSRAYQFVAWFLTIVFILALGGAVFVQARERFSPDSYALALGIIETGIAAYVAQVVQALFGGEARSAPETPAS